VFDISIIDKYNGFFVRLRVGGCYILFFGGVVRCLGVVGKVLGWGGGGVLW